MRVWPEARTARRALLLLCGLLFSTQAIAYEHPLSDKSVRDAYFLGMDSPSNYQAFLDPYIIRLPPAKSLPAVTEIELRTPFAQAVVRSHERTVGYSAPQAERDYQKLGDTIQVRIGLRFASELTTFVPPAACQGASRMQSVQDCLSGYRFRFIQDGRQFRPRSEYGAPIYSVADTGVLIGGDIWFEFDSAAIRSRPFHVLVTLPGGRTASADFDLASLR